MKVQSCKLYNNKYMIASIQIADTEIFAFINISQNFETKLGSYSQNQLFPTLIMTNKAVALMM